MVIVVYKAFRYGFTVFQLVLKDKPVLKAYPFILGIRALRFPE
jgi:hypothetical protein